MKDDKLYLRHIIDSIEKVGMYLEGLEKEEFLSEKGLVQDAVVRQLEIVGEAARNISEDFKNSHLEIPWRCRGRQSG